MIAQLTGTVTSSGIGYTILTVGGVGYRIHTTLEIIRSLPRDGSAITFFTHLAVRENSMDLFGFLHENEVTFFELLISVSGIGPKSALAIMNLETVTALSSAISQGDTTYLTKVSGIGRKSAEKIIIELRDKTALLSEADSVLHSEDAEALEGLQSLGYSIKEAREALKELPKDVHGTGERITAALKLLGK
ncbi:MAG: Holliday junction branch migration protein RuvA [Candidatus Paceibacterota bacterium]